MPSPEQASPPPPASAAADLRARLNALGAALARWSPAQKITAAAGGAFVFAMLAALLLWKGEAEYAVLFSNLDARDGAAIITALQQQNVPYRLSGEGSVILVPQTTVHETRLRLAAGGLPSGGHVGFELLDEQKIGLSQFGEQVNYQRSLQGELARTISAMGAVAAARVHLAIPRPTAFLRDSQKPSASVFITLRPGRTLDAGQIAGIVHLVSASVPQLSPAAVSLVNERGELLTAPDGVGGRLGLNASQIGYVRQLEADYVARINHLLEPLFGASHFRAQVTADVDFSEVEQTAETFKPNPTNDQAIRSQTLADEQQRAPKSLGVPGALTNQPPVPATAPITTPPVAPGTPAGDQSTRTSSTTNYEVDRTIAHVKRPVGQIKRLSVAVVVNEEALTPPPDPATGIDPLKLITNLVTEAVGIQEARGDTLAVSSTRFLSPDGPAIPLWQDQEMLQLINTLLIWVMVLVTGVVAYFALLRPLLRASPGAGGGPRDAGAADPTAGADDVRVSLTGHRDGTTAAGAAAGDYAAHLDRARDLARTDPRLVANVIREWMK